MSLSNKVKSFFQAVMKPSPAAVSQAFKVPYFDPIPKGVRKSHSLKPHVPLIKFRKGSGASASHGVSASTPSSPAMAAATRLPPSAPSTPLKQNEAYQLPVIEDWQLPMRFRRRLIDSEEIDFINRGGPDKL